MTNEEKILIKGKKFEATIALFLLIPPILGVIAFVLCLCDNYGAFARMSNLSNTWSSGGGIPSYLGLIAIAGVYLLKDSFKYLFIKTEENKPDSK